MVKIILTILLVVFSLTLLAEEESVAPLFNIIGRGQYIDTDNKPTASGVKNYSAFNISYLKLKSFGKFNDSTSYNVSLDATTTANANDGTSGVSSFVDLAFVRKKFSEKRKLEV